MNQKLSEIQKQLAALNQLISEYLKSSEEERFVIKKEDFNKIKHIGELSQSKVFEYENGIIFQMQGRIYNEYEFKIYEKLLDGTLDKLILVKKLKPSNINNFSLNYVVESFEETRLKDLYG